MFRNRAFVGSQISDWHGIRPNIRTKDILINFYVYGAGGRASGGAGGDGGLVSGKIFVNRLSRYSLLVGETGQYRAAGAGAGSRVLGNGGLCGNQGYGGQGGGFSGIFSNGAVSFANSLVVAGGGGGGAWEGAVGGAGGGLTGNTGGSGAVVGGSGGTQSAGGTGGAGSGGQLIGGDCGGSGDGGGGGGGGGGYYGGGAGSGANPGSAGGGGSSYSHPMCFDVVNTTGGGAGNSSNGYLIIDYPNYHNDLILESGLTYTYSTSANPGFKRYTFTAGTANIIFN